MAKDIYHNTVRRALEADGWTITEDPLKLKFGEQNVYVDLGAEAPMEAERGGRKIAVEVKSFLSASPVTEIERAVGQYVFYLPLIETQRADTPLYLAVPARVYASHLSSVDGRNLLSRWKIPLILYDTDTERIVQWIEPTTP